MADLFKQYATDPDLEQNGAWIDVDSSDEPDREKRAQFLVVFDDHADVQRALDEHQREYSQFYMRPGKRVPAEVKLMGEVRVAAAAVKSWKNVELDGATALPTKANKERLFREVRFLREQVILLSGRTETFRREMVAEVGKDFAPSSPGT